MISSLSCQLKFSLLRFGEDAVEYAELHHESMRIDKQQSRMYLFLF